MLELLLYNRKQSDTRPRGMGGGTSFLNYHDQTSLSKELLIFLVERGGVAGESPLFPSSNLLSGRFFAYSLRMQLASDLISVTVTWVIVKIYCCVAKFFVKSHASAVLNGRSTFQQLQKIFLFLPNVIAFNTYPNELAYISHSKCTVV